MGASALVWLNQLTLFCYLIRSRVLGLVSEQIHNKLKISGNVQKTIPYKILKAHICVISWAKIIIKMSLISLNICFLGDKEFNFNNISTRK